MTSVFINIGEGFKDDKLNIFRRQLEKRMPVVSVDYARENLEKINDLKGAKEGREIDDILTGYIFYLETVNCNKNKNYTKAFCNLLSCITTMPSAIYLMPYAPKEIVRVIRTQWPETEIYLFEYHTMTPARKI